jgi:Ca2+-binding RTX toxin-like protein
MRFEQLESRDVPAVILDAAGSILSITEVPGDTADDAITLTQNGDSVTVESFDGIYVGGKYVGTVFTLDNVKRIDVSLTQGGNDRVSDDTDLPVSIDAGPGDDFVSSSGGTFNPLLLPFLQAGAVAPELLPLLAEEFGRKELFGGDGHDAIFGPPVGFYAELSGGAGDDTILSGFGPDVVDGGSGPDALFTVGGGDVFLAADGEFDIVLGFAVSLVSDPFDAVIRF